MVSLKYCIFVEKGDTMPACLSLDKVLNPAKVGSKRVAELRCF